MAAILVCVLSAVFCAQAAVNGSAGETAPAPWLLPVSRSMRQVLEGSVRINRTPARYFVYTVQRNVPRLDISSRARQLGWRLLPDVERTFLSLVGAVKLRGYGRDEKLLLIGEPEHSGDGERWVVMALLDRKPVWMDAHGDAPGREPAAWPRLASARRVLHLAGKQFEVACYRSAASLSILLAEARARLMQEGWRITQAGEQGLSAVRWDGSEAVLFGRAEDPGCTFLVMAYGKSR